MTRPFPLRPVRFAPLALAGLMALSGCGALVVGGTAATTALVATDRRTTGEQVEDKSIEMKIGNEMRKLVGDNGRVTTVSYAGRVLLLGDVPTEADRQRAEELARGVEKVKVVYNQLRVGDITPLSVRSNDTWLTTRVKTSLINTKDVPARTINVTTERGVVYLQGKVTEAEGQMAAKAAASVPGVNKVVKLFEIVAGERLVTDTAAPAANAGPSAPISDLNSGASPSSDPGAASGDVQTMPVQ